MKKPTETIDTQQFDTAQIDTARIDPAQIDPAQIDPAQIDTTQIDTTQIDTTQIDTTRLDAETFDAFEEDGATRQLKSKMLFFGVCTAVFMVGAIIGGSALFRLTRASTEKEFILQGQAAQLARAGLTETVNWLRRQSAQPVIRFAPSKLDSLDPAIGLVQEFPITDGIWGRFEVWRADGDSQKETRRELGAQDISIERGYEAEGSMWRLRCVGFVFERTGDRPFDRNAAFVLHREVLEAEVSRLGLRLPGQSALCVRDGAKTVVGMKARVVGGDAAVGIYYGSPRRPPDVGVGEVSGVAAIAPAAMADLYDDSVRAVFGVERPALIAMADDYITQASYFPAHLRSNSLYCVEVPELNCTPARPLRGSGILYVKGNLTINAGSESEFAGLLYVDGDLTIHSSAQLTGAVVVTGQVAIHGGGDWSAVTYDDGIVRGMRDAVGSYRISTPVRRVGDGSVGGE